MGEIGAASRWQARAREGIGQCQIQIGNITVGSTYLKQALDIYQRIGSTKAKRVQKIINDLDGS